MCYTYDNNRLTQLKRGEAELASFTYDANGRKLTQSNANGTVSEYVYNAAGLVTKLENKLGETTLSSWDYAYRLDGIQTAKTDKDGVKTSYAYDMVGRLVKEQTSTSEENAEGETVETVTGAIAYTYDGYGNRASVTATGYPVYSETYTYDGANRLTSRTRTEDGESTTTVNTYDLNGNFIKSVKGEGASAEVTTRSYNGFGQQVSHKNSEREVWFRYRPDGMRHSKQIIAGSGASGTTTVTTHLWDGQDIVAEMSTNGTTKAAYLRGNGELVAEIIGEAASYYLHNAHGDVTERVDAGGVVLKRYTYDAFGNILNPATVGNPAVYVDQSPFGYCGEYLDKETGEIYLRARYYDSESGRFNSEDPLRDSANWYAYCENDPVNNEDPSGLASLRNIWDGFKKAVRNVVRTVAKAVAKAVVKTVVSKVKTAVTNLWQNTKQAVVSAAERAVNTVGLIINGPKIAAASAVALVSGEASAQDIAADIKNYNYLNTDEKAVVASSVFSSYKGTTVIRHNIPDLTSCAIFNTIFLNKNSVGKYDVQHEWGHSVQERWLGTPRYAIAIALPSVTSFLINPTNPDYYSQPWERTADFFGGVDRQNYTPNSLPLALVYFGIWSVIGSNYIPW